MSIPDKRASILLDVPVSFPTRQIGDEERRAKMLRMGKRRRVFHDDTGSLYADRLTGNSSPSGFDGAQPDELY